MANEPDSRRSGGTPQDDRLQERLEQLAREHRSYDEELRRLLALPHLGPAQEARVRDLKKLKLCVKDEMAEIQRQGAATAGGPA